MGLAMGHPLYIYYHTHWDREWYLPFRKYQHRLLKVVDQVIDSVSSGALPCFTLDGQTVLLEDYLEFRPKKQAALTRLVQEERVSIGPWYVMPDEFLVSGESLIRNLQRGLKISHAFGEKTFSGYLPDTFGHSADIPMILNLFEIHNAIIWRGVSARNPYFYWQSPSGHRVLTYHLTAGYFQNAMHMAKDFAEKEKSFQDWLEKVSNLSGPDQPLLYPVGADHLGVQPDAVKVMQAMAPEATTVTPDTFMTVFQPTQPLETIEGELRDFKGAYLLPGTFSSRMYLKQWNRRLEWRLTRQLEQLHSWERLLGDRPDYDPQLDFLWKTLLLNHPHDSICGCSVDEVHRENEVRFEAVDELSDSLILDSHHRIRTQLQPENGLLVLNLGDKPYTGVVEIQADYPLSQPNPPAFENSQVLSETTILDEAYLLDTSSLALSENQALRRKSLIWVEGLPAHGYQVLTQTAKAMEHVKAEITRLENEKISLAIQPDGDLWIQVKAGDRFQRKTICQIRRNQEQGDSYNAAPVPGASPEKAVFISSEVINSGPLRGTLKLLYRFESIQMPLETLVSLDAGSEAFSFRTSFVNTAPDHKIQVIFKTQHPVTEVMAEGHFSPVFRQYDPEYRIEDHMPAPPQTELLVQGGPIQIFIGFQEQTLVTEGLTEYEVEADNLKLTLHRGFGMLSRADTGVRGSHAGPPLPTPEGQCLNRRFECRYLWANGFAWDEAYALSDRFYGAVYGFDRQQDSQERIEAVSKSFLTLDNPFIVSTAMVLQGPAMGVRLMNLSPQEQTTGLTLSSPVGTMSIVNLKGDVIELISPSSRLKLGPYELKTVAFGLE